MWYNLPVFWFAGKPIGRELTRLNAALHPATVYQCSVNATRCFSKYDQYLLMGTACKLRCACLGAYLFMYSHRPLVGLAEVHEEECALFLCIGDDLRRRNLSGIRSEVVRTQNVSQLMPPWERRLCWHFSQMAFLPFDNGGMLGLFKFSWCPVADDFSGTEECEKAEIPWSSFYA